MDTGLMHPRGKEWIKATLKVERGGKSTWTYAAGTDDEADNPKDVFEEAQGAKLEFFRFVDSTDKVASQV